MDLSAGDIGALAAHIHNQRDIGASISSGSFRTLGMLVAACSVTTANNPVWPEYECQPKNERLRNCPAGAAAPARCSLVVASLSREEAENVYRIRAVLEALVVEQFIEKASEAEVQNLRRESESLKAAYRAGILPDMLAAKRAFYDRICTGADNAIAFDIINRLVLRTSSLRSRSMMRPERQAQSVVEIETLVQAIQRRDCRRRPSGRNRTRHQFPQILPGSPNQPVKSGTVRNGSNTPQPIKTGSTTAPAHSSR